MFYSEQKKQFQILNRRTFFLFIGKLSIFSVIGWKLFDIQIKNSKKYQTLSINNQINIEILYPVRGEILDRNNNILASNIKVFDLYIIPENTNNILKTLDNLDKVIKLDFKQKREIIALSKKVKKFERIKIVENLDWTTLELIEVNKQHLTGLNLIQDFQRTYPQKHFFSHILGYVNQPSITDLKLPFILKMPTLDIGKTGLEKSFNEQLIGKAGKREIEVNASGRIIREISKEPSIRGKNIIVSIDQQLQRYTYQQLEKFQAGSIVVLDINAGHILSMVSIPTYDSNLIIKKPNFDYWDSLLNNSLSPLTNRTIQGLYAPGSTFKMIVAIAALKYNIIKPAFSIFCEGKIDFGDRTYHCWKKNGHGKMNVETAIKESCDVYFYELSKKVGIDRIAEVAKDFGLGQKYQINLENQKAGIIPTKKWKKETFNENWYAGETLNAGIGQGYILTNPLQLAVMTARIASGGKIIKPSIIHNTVAKEFSLMKKYISSIKLIQKALFKVVNEIKGTANKSKSHEFSFSGKTGTSQVKRISLIERESEDFRKKEIKWKDRDHALFVGYMPSKNPKYAISVVIEHGGSGASVAAPIAKNVFNFLHEHEI